MRTRWGRKRWSLGAGLLCVALILGLPMAAHAADPVDFGTSHIADKVGALGGRQSEVQAAIDSLYANTRVDLYVVYVDSFTGPSDRQQWAADTANKNGMGINDVLLAVATVDRQYQLSVDPGFQLTDAQIADVGTNAVEPALRENDWAGAGIGAADGLAASINGQAVTAPDITPGQATPSGGGGNGWGFLWILVIAVVVIGAIIFFVRRRTSASVGGSAGGAAAGSGHPAGPPPVPTAELKQRAGSALVQTDDAIKTSEQELGFAIAQYGAQAAEPFRAALGTAKQQITQAFTLQQKLDDAVPDTEEQARTWYAEIIDLCRKANAALDEQVDAFDELRALEKNAPKAAASVASEFAGLTQRIGQAESQLASLAQGYTPAAISTVADNAAQARERLTFAQAALADANGKLTSGDSGTAAVGIRAAEDATDQAKLLLDAIDRLAADLQKAAQGVTATIADLETDLITARALPVGAGTGGGAVAGAAASAPGVIAATEQAVADAKNKLAAGPINPLDLVRNLEATNKQMDTMLSGVRDAQAQAKRAQTALGHTMLSARSQVSAAEDYISARRGAVGAEARTRLAEAGRLLEQAESLAQSDPAAALAVAQRASSLGAEAIRLAENDVSGFGGAGAGMGGGVFGGGSGSSGGGNGMMGAILGGIIINSVLGGGGGGMFGGGGGGRRGGGGGFGSAGSFGGSGTRSRRGGGGRF
jgi:uncharacterized membrane protein YgcG